MAFLIKSKFDESDVISLTHKATCHCTDPVSCNKLKKRYVVETELYPMITLRSKMRTPCHARNKMPAFKAYFMQVYNNFNCFKFVLC